MPRLSDSMEEGTILKWLKSDGDEVSKGEELVEIETDKANMTYEADESGTLEIVAQEGDTLPVGETICKLGEGGGGSSDEDEDEDEERSARGRRGGRGRGPGRRRRGGRGRGRSGRRARRGRRAGRRARSRGRRGRVRGARPEEERRARARTGARRGRRRARQGLPDRAPDRRGEGRGPLHHRGQRPRRADRQGRPRGQAGRSAEEAALSRPGPRRDRGSRALPPAAHGRAADGGVQGHRAGLRDDARGRHGRGRRASASSSRPWPATRRRRPSTTS